jgi:hypothetical protein
MQVNLGIVAVQCHSSAHCLGLESYLHKYSKFLNTYHFFEPETIEGWSYNTETDISDLNRKPGTKKKWKPHPKESKHS